MAFYHSSGFKYLKNLIIGVGAAIVMVGALFKLTHHPLADIFLTVGLLTEAAIFTLQGILPPHDDYYWEKIYPGVNKYSASAASGANMSDELDKALAKNNISGDGLSRLGDHLGKLGASMEGLSKVVNTASVTDEFALAAKGAAKALDDVKISYSNAATVAQSLSAATDGTRNYHEQVQAISKNLAALNAVYELELQDTNNHLKAMNTFYGHLTNAINNLNESVEDTKSYKAQMGSLAKNLASLNNVYGNMLNAMATSVRS